MKCIILRRKMDNNSLLEIRVIDKIKDAMIEKIVTTINYKNYE